VIINIANSPLFGSQASLQFIEKSRQNFLATLAQKELIKAGTIPYTIVRTTQFFDFGGPIAQSGTEVNSVRFPLTLMQRIVSDEVALALVDAVIAELQTKTDKFVESLSKLGSHTYLRIHHKPEKHCSERLLKCQIKRTVF
tara:strand:+ start:16765 stop:17187 length:423 start_codon:yes stop_codon:yes gene_type:complete